MAKSESVSMSAEEKAAMKDYAAERRERAKRKGPEGAALDLADVLAAYEKMPTGDRELGLRVHELVLKAAPQLAPKTWYGMPAYALDGKVICFFQSAGKFKVRYHTFGFSENAALDEGAFWPTSFALLELSPKVEAELTRLVKQAVSA